jgi:hypothetical protein
MHLTLSLKLSLESFLKTSSMLLLSASSVFIQPTYADTDFSTTQSIQYQDQHIVIIGSIDTVFVQRIKAAYQIAPRSQPITTLEITSTGGDVEAAIDLGEFIFNNQLSVYIPELCLSSCANYLFTAGKEKIITPNTVLGWHGGALQKNLKSNSNLTERQLLHLQKQEKYFFQLIKVDQRICTLGQEAPHKIRDFWNYSLADLKKMGLRHIEINLSNIKNTRKNLQYKNSTFNIERIKLASQTQ